MAYSGHGRYEGDMKVMERYGYIHYNKLTLLLKGGFEGECITNITKKIRCFFDHENTESHT